MKILLIEDEAELRKSIKKFLHNEGYVVESAEDFVQADEIAEVYNYDCILVDISLPGGSGLEIIRKIKKQKNNCGIIIISAKNSVDDKVVGLEIGADDYLSKPFHLSELNARIKALIRRNKFEGDDNVCCNEIKADLNSRRVFVHDKEIVLTTKEFDLLLFFVSNKNKVLTKAAIAEHLWGNNADQMDNHDFIYTHIKNLRKKLLDKGCNDYIHTIYGAGYNFKTI